MRAALSRLRLAVGSGDTGQALSFPPSGRGGLDAKRLRPVGVDLDLRAPARAPAGSAPGIAAMAVRNPALVDAGRAGDAQDEVLADQVAQARRVVRRDGRWPRHLRTRLRALRPRRRQPGHELDPRSLEARLRPRLARPRHGGRHQRARRGLPRAPPRLDLHGTRSNAGLVVELIGTAQDIQPIRSVASLNRFLAADTVTIGEPPVDGRAGRASGFPRVRSSSAAPLIPPMPPGPSPSPTPGPGTFRPPSGRAPITSPSRPAASISDSLGILNHGEHSAHEQIGLPVLRLVLPARSRDGSWSDHQHVRGRRPRVLPAVHDDLPLHPPGERPAPTPAGEFPFEFIASCRNACGIEVGRVKAAICETPVGEGGALISGGRAASAGRSRRAISRRRRRPPMPSTARGAS